MAGLSFSVTKTKVKLNPLNFGPPIWIGLALASFFLSIFVGIVLVKIQKISFENSPLYFDPVGYLFHNATLYVRLASENRLSVAWQEWLVNFRHPLRTVPLILFMPDLLAHPLGHLATGLPMLFFFLWLLGWTIYMRTESIIYAIACMSLFCSLPGIYDLKYGLGAYWLDMPAAFLVGAALLCLLNLSGLKDTKWLVFFSIFASCAALSRYAATGYLVGVGLPLVVGYLIQKWKKEREFWKGILYPLGIIAGIVSAIAGYYLVSHLKQNILYYSGFCYALGDNNFITTVRALVPPIYFFTSRSVAITLVMIWIANSIFFLRVKILDLKKVAISVWLIFSVTLFQTFVLRINSAEAQFQFIYAAISVFIGSLLPINSTRSASLRQWFKVVGIILCVLAFFSGVRSIRGGYHLAEAVSFNRVARKNFDKTLAEKIVKEGKNLVWAAFFDEYTPIPTMEAFYAFRELPLPADANFFTVHRKYWETLYPKLEPNTVCKLVYENTKKKINVAVVFDNPQMANTQFDNEYSREVAKYVSREIRVNPNWEKIFVIESPQYGLLAGYRNLSLKRSYYSEVLNGD